MKTSVPCPHCQKPISALRLGTALTPSLRCPHCLRPLRAKASVVLLLALAGLALALILGLRLMQSARVVGGLPVQDLLLSLVIVAGFVLVVGLTLVNLGKLSKRD
jgi:hypothetical protein